MLITENESEPDLVNMDSKKNLSKVDSSEYMTNDKENKTKVPI